MSKCLYSEGRVEALVTNHLRDYVLNLEKYKVVQENYV